MVYFMLTRGEAFVDKGQQHYEEQQRQRSIAALKRRAAALGFQLSASSVAIAYMRRSTTLFLKSAALNLGADGDGRAKGLFQTRYEPGAP